MADEMKRVLDEAAIRRVIDRYCHAVDRGSADDVAALFHAEGNLVVFGEVHKGRAEVRQWYANYHDNFRSKLDSLRHKISNVLIDFEGDDAARVVSYMDADAVAKGTEEVLPAIGRYDDRFVRDQGEWLFAQREIVPYQLSPKLAALLE